MCRVIYVPVVGSLILLIYLQYSMCHIITPLQVGISFQYRIESFANIINM